MVIFDEEKQNKKIEGLHKKEEEEMSRYLAHELGLEYVDLTALPINTDALRTISEGESREAQLAVFDIVSKKIKVAVRSPENEITKKALAGLTKKAYEPTLFIASTESLEKVWQRYSDLSFSFETKAGSLDISNEEITNFLGSVKRLEDVKKLITDVLAMKKSYRVSRILEIIVAGALSTSASDIHLEPEESDVRLRFRLDGVLIDILRFDRETYALLLSRIKLLSGLKLNLEGAQDGRFSVKVGTSDIEIRTSVLPSAYKESIVLRVLNPDAIAVPMEELGIEPRLYEIIEREIVKPNGMILTTGPTGSGKTTTLYAFLKKIHSPGIKIITIEDPIEYHLPGIVQTQTDTDKAYTFLDGLRSALRQDPDVIMVGEIRDKETAGIAISASLTGHLVFSTLHTNNAAGAFPRLIDLGVNPKILTSAVTIVLAQRLVRKLCPHCKAAGVLTKDEETYITKIISGLGKKAPAPDTIQVWKAVGCTLCNDTGYKGRIGIFEAIESNKKIEAVLEDNPSEREVRAVAEDQNILTMQEDGVLKVLKGVTTLDELRRVINLEADE